MNDSWEIMIKSDLSLILFFSSAKIYFFFLQLKYSTFKRSVSQDSEDEHTQKSGHQALLTIIGD